MNNCAQAREILKKKHIPTLLKCDCTHVMVNISKDVTQHVIKKGTYDFMTPVHNAI
jgi:hypothetical protein